MNEIQRQLINEIAGRIVNRYAPYTDKESQTPIDVFVTGIVLRVLTGIGRREILPEMIPGYMGQLGPYNKYVGWDPQKWMEVRLKEGARYFMAFEHPVPAYRLKEKK